MIQLFLSCMVVLKHWGFNLEASLQGDESTLGVKNHKLTIKVMSACVYL